MALMVTHSGVRGIVGQTLFPGTFTKYIGGFALTCRKHFDEKQSKNLIILGRDSRISGPWVIDLAASVLCAYGFDVLDIGIVPTPTVQWYVQQKAAAGGLIITSSHNPREWNGLKFVGSDGLFFRSTMCVEAYALSDVIGAQVELSDAHKKEYRLCPWPACGVRTYEEGVERKHVDAVLALPYVDVAKVQALRLKVVLDAVNGAGGPALTYLLKKMGCEVVELNTEPTGEFAHTPEPIPCNLSELCGAVRAHGAALGVAVDPDTDRCVLIDERGEPVGEEYTLVTAIYFLTKVDAIKRKEDNSFVVVKNLSTSRAVDDIVEAAGGRTVAAPVGEIKVAEKMLELESDIGGEGNGGVMLRDVHIGRDAPVAACLALCALAESGAQGLSGLKSALPQWEIVKMKCPLGNLNVNDVLSKVKAAYSAPTPPAGTPLPLTLNEEDGIRIDTPEWWVHLRKSNTEPIVRVIAEAHTVSGAEKVCEKFMKEMTGQ